MSRSFAYFWLALTLLPCFALLVAALLLKALAFVGIYLAYSGLMLWRGFELGCWIEHKLYGPEE